jgi:hypothetical protein
MIAARVMPGAFLRVQESFTTPSRGGSVPSRLAVLFAGYRVMRKKLIWEACRGKAYDDGIISSQYQVDHNDLSQS